jgi:alpha-L-arabinofuranosidase
MRKAKFFAAALLAMSSLGAFAQHQFTVQANKPGAEIQPTMSTPNLRICFQP